jgi:hypothetical protein
VEDETFRSDFSARAARVGVVSPQAIRSTLDIDVRDEPDQRMLCRVRQGGGRQSEGV